MIRKMFEAGNELRKKYGNDKVYDFSLGNPDVPAPAAVKTALKDIAEKADQPFALGYMPNAGYPDCRAKLGEYLTREQGVPVPGSHVVATCGAAGGINAFFRAVLEPGDEVICFGSCGKDSITPDDWAELKGTHAYDIICTLGNRVQRIAR